MAKVLKLISVDKVEAGDNLVLNGVHYTCEYVDNDGIAFDLQLHDVEGNKIRKTLLAGEQVSLEI